MKSSLFEVVKFGESAKELSDRLKAGQGVEIEGRLEQDKWEDKEGKVRAKVKIVVSSIQLFSE
jgi:single-strand DNA-binding protein